MWSNPVSELLILGYQLLLFFFSEKSDQDGAVVVRRETLFEIYVWLWAQVLARTFTSS